MAFKKEYVARWHRRGVAWYPAAYAKHADNFDMATVAVRVTLDRDPDRSVWVVLDPDEARTLAKQLILTADKAEATAQANYPI